MPTAHSSVAPKLIRYWMGQLTSADAGSARYFRSDNSGLATTDNGCGAHRIDIVNGTDKQLRLFVTFVGTDPVNQGIASTVIYRVELGSAGARPTATITVPIGHYISTIVALWFADNSDSTPDTPAGAVRVYAYQYEDDFMEVPPAGPQIYKV